MKQLLVLSGKGGTGKTTIVSSFIELSKSKAFADCDVDAPNLHLVVKEEVEPIKMEYFGMEKAYINQELCLKCGLCYSKCRFKAISISENDGYVINPYACEGCSVCESVCPNGAIEMYQSNDGDMEVYKGDHVFSTAKLRMGSGTSGKLVTSVKKNLKDNLVEEKVDLAIIDGSPGIGCPVIASVTGVDLVLVVTEPTVSGMSDMERVVEVAQHFQLPVAICVNKYDINESIADQIKAYTKNNNLFFVGNIPYDKALSNSINHGENPITKKIESSKWIREVYNKTISIL